MVFFHYSTLCFGAKIISQEIILTLKVKVPGLIGVFMAVCLFYIYNHFPLSIPTGNGNRLASVH